MDDVPRFVMVALTLWSLFAFAGAFISQAKGRPGFEGVVFGFMLGPIGLLITALMPTIAKPGEAKPTPVAPTPSPQKTGVRRRIGGPGDDAAMDFVMDLIRRNEADQSRAIRHDA